MVQHHFGPSNSHDTSLPPVTSLTRHWSLQGDCRQVGSIDTSNLRSMQPFPFSLDSDVRSIFKRALVIPPKTPDLTRIGLPHHIDCLLNRARRDGPWSKHPCQLLQVLALDRLVSFSSTSTRPYLNANSMRTLQLTRQSRLFHCHGSWSLACYWQSVSGRRGIRPQYYGLSMSPAGGGG
jgi:hypothetical protein